VSDYSNITAHVIAPPTLPRRPVWPRAGLTLGVSVVVSFLMGLASALLADRLDQRFHSVEELRQLTGVPILGRVALMPGDQSAHLGSIGLISHVKPRSVWAESFRVARVNLDFLGRSRDLKVIQVTSPAPGDGRSTAASNLAISFAATGRKVLLLDADLRNPSLDRSLGLDPGNGLSALLRDGEPLCAAVQRPHIEHLDVVTAGPPPSNSAELLASSRLAHLMDEARAAYDVIIIDSSPLLTAADPAIVSSFVDGVVLVVKPAQLKRVDAERSLELFRNLGTPLLGVLANEAGQKRKGSRYGSDPGDPPGPAEDDPYAREPGRPEGPSDGNPKYQLGGRSNGRNGEHGRPA
jgi:capsular exopolysaccharide synthesis family protein